MESASNAPQEGFADTPEGIAAFVEEMIGHLAWELDVECRAGENDTIELELRGPDRDVVLQNRAEVLEVFQYLLNRAFGRKAPGRRIVVDCEGFRARKEAELKEIATRVSERVKLTGNQEELGLMNPYERRIVHLAVAEEEGVTTESFGDGLLKRVVILPG